MAQENGMPPPQFTPRRATPLVRRAPSKDRDQATNGACLRDLFRASNLGICPWQIRTRFRQSCGRWSCPSCSLQKGKNFALDVHSGLVWASRNEISARLFTLTDG